MCLKDVLKQFKQFKQTINIIIVQYNCRVVFPTRPFAVNYPCDFITL